MATCCLSQTGAIFVLLAISKPCIRFRWSLYRFQPKSSHLSSGMLSLPSYCLFVFLMDSFFFLAGFQSRWPLPSISLLSLLASCSLFCYAYAAIPTTCLSCLPNCHVKPLTHVVLENRCLAMLPLCSAPLIASLVAGGNEVCSMLGHGYVGMSQYLLF